ncbi:MAG: vWA domain-containing protein, partial [Planctomycetota bacterium]
MNFAHPQLLLLLFLVPAVARYVRVRGRPALGGLRIALLVLLVVCLAGPQLSRVQSGVDLIVVADRSASVGDEGWRSQEELLRHLGAARGPNDRIGVVAFGMAPVVESRPERGRTGGQVGEAVDPNGSDLAEALRAAGRLVEPTRRTRLLVLSDGRYTGRDPSAPEILAEVPLWQAPANGA